MDTLVLATRNAHKVTELRDMLAGHPAGGSGLTVRDMTDFPDCGDVVEDLDTLEGNALKKAREAYRCTGLPVIADDSGLEVNYLLGAPGVHSARYAGENVTYADNNRKLLHELRGVPPRRRDACFRCVIAFVDGRREELFSGRVDGYILPEARGRQGFGYDPLFRPVGESRSYAELSAEEKNRISHRTLALRNFLVFLSSIRGAA